MSQTLPIALTNSFFRLVRLLQILHSEHVYFLKNSKNSGVKNCLKRMKDCYDKNMLELATYLTPESQKRLLEQMDEEKAEAISAMFGKIVMLDTASVLLLEDDLNTILKVEEVEVL
jgi:hypothetical protein